MKTTIRSIGRIAGTLLALFALASASFAANPLSYPWGLALDSKGNLYVANANANNILVFSPGYQLQTAKTITQGISVPSGVAFDPLGISGSQIPGPPTVRTAVSRSISTVYSIQAAPSPTAFSSRLRSPRMDWAISTS